MQLPVKECIPLGCGGYRTHPQPLAAWLVGCPASSVQDGTPVTSHEVRLFADGNLAKEVTGLPGTTQSYQLTLPDINTTRAMA